MINTYHSLQVAMCKERNHRQCLGETLETVWEKYELQYSAITSKHAKPHCHCSSPLKTPENGCK